MLFLFIINNEIIHRFWDSVLYVCRQIKSLSGKNSSLQAIYYQWGIDEEVFGVYIF
jgi:hypothetical protein